MPWRQASSKIHSQEKKDTEHATQDVSAAVQVQSTTKTKANSCCITQEQREKDGEPNPESHQLAQQLSIIPDTVFCPKLASISMLARIHGNFSLFWPMAFTFMSWRLAKHWACQELDKGYHAKTRKLLLTGKMVANLPKLEPTWLPKS